MTALLLEAPAAARTPAPVRAALPTRRRADARACTDTGRPRLRVILGGATAEAVPARLYWTRRGLAVVLALVALVVGAMASTLVVAFFSVSNEPPLTPAGHLAAVTAGVSGR